MAFLLTPRARLGKRVGATDDLTDFLGDLGLRAWLAWRE